MLARTAEDLLGHRLGRYRLDAILGRGGMGVVFAATHSKTGASVAIKLLHAHHVHRDAIVRRFVREARAAAQLEHPHVVRVLDVDDEREEGVYIVLERLRGHTLGEELGRERKLAAERAVRLLLPIADALDAAHAAGIVHRDLKPSNVFLARDGEVAVPKLLDFGVAKLLDSAEESDTMTGEALGTPAYMAPEQVRGDVDVGAGADVWAFGVVLHECLAGERPFGGATRNATLAAVLTEEPANLEGDDEIAGWVARCLTRDVTERPSMAAVRGGLRALADARGWAPSLPEWRGAPGEERAEATTTGGPAVPVRRRRPVAAASLGIAVAVTVAVTVAAGGSRETTRDGVAPAMGAEPLGAEPLRSESTSESVEASRSESDSESSEGSRSEREPRSESVEASRSDSSEGSRSESESRSESVEASRSESDSESSGTARSESESRSSEAARTTARVLAPVARSRLESRPERGVAAEEEASPPRGETPSSHEHASRSARGEAEDEASEPESTEPPTPTRVVLGTNRAPILE